jgi:hypothetical protein
MGFSAPEHREGELGLLATLLRASAPWPRGRLLLCDVALGRSVVLLCYCPFLRFAAAKDDACQLLHEVEDTVHDGLEGVDGIVLLSRTWLASVPTSD